jgi:apolipoprotein N-acyltransferase
MKIKIVPISRTHSLLALFSGVLLGLAWHKPFTPLIFIGFVPLFLLLQHHSTAEQNNIQKDKISLLVFYFAFVIWNLVAYWWLYYVGIVAFLFAVLVNSWLMLLTVSLFRYLNRKTNYKFGIAIFIPCWLTFEFLHTQNWGGSWTWLNLGNAFGNLPQFVQWYEYTGVFGGSLWVLLVNFLAFGFISYSNTSFDSLKKRKLALLLATLLLPSLLSLFLFYNYAETGQEVEIVSIQPNFDTYTEKFEYNARTGETNKTTFVPFDRQFERFLALIRNTATQKTALVLLPETAWNQDIDESALPLDPYIPKMKQFKDSFPNLSVLTGADTYQFYSALEKPTPTARYHSLNTFYDVYNSAMFFDTQNNISFYHKSMLVIGVESNPLRNVLGFLQKTIMVNMSGLVGDLGTQENRTVFKANDNIKAAPIVCYESIYGEYVTDYVKNGANLLCIITNDGWWDDSPAPRQHLSFASLRAIETRRAIARSANTGISAFINQRGEILQRSNYNEAIALKGIVKLNDSQTFYVRFGDFIAKIAFGLVCMGLVFAIFQTIRKK